MFRAPKICRVELRINKTFLDGITNSLDMGLRKLWEMVKGREAWHAAVHGFSKNQTWLSELNRTEAVFNCRFRKNSRKCSWMMNKKAIWQYSVEELFVYGHEGYWFIIFFSSKVFAWFWYQGYTGTSSPILLAVGATLQRLYQWMRISPVSCPSSHSFFFQKSVEKRFQVGVNYFYISSYQWLYAWPLVIH